MRQILLLLLLRARKVASPALLTCTFCFTAAALPSVDAQRRTPSFELAPPMRLVGDACCRGGWASGRISGPLPKSAPPTREFGHIRIQTRRCRWGTQRLCRCDRAKLEKNAHGTDPHRDSRQRFPACACCCRPLAQRSLLRAQQRNHFPRGRLYHHESATASTNMFARRCAGVSCKVSRPSRRLAAGSWEGRGDPEA
jgi:hypothetical protein